MMLRKLAVVSLYSYRELEELSEIVYGDEPECPDRTLVYLEDVDNIEKLKPFLSKEEAEKIEKNGIDTILFLNIKD